MDKREVSIPVWKLDNGKIYINAKEIARGLDKGYYKKGTLYNLVYPDNNVTRFPGKYYTDDIYEDIPDIEVCIGDNTEIKGRRKGGIRKK